MQTPSSHLSIFIEAMILRNNDGLGNLSPTDGKYFYALITDNVLVFSSYRYVHFIQDDFIINGNRVYSILIIFNNIRKFSSYIRTMLIDQRVYITVVNFNMRRTTIDIDEQFYPIPSKAEILIESTPNRWFNTTANLTNFKNHNMRISNEINLNNIELSPFESLLLRVDPIENTEHA